MKSKFCPSPLSNKKARALAVVLVVFVVFVIILVAVSNKLQQEVTGIDDNKSPAPVAAVTPAPKPAPKKYSHEMTRRTIVVRGNDFLEHWFYDGEEVVAKQQVNNEGVMNTEGTIPDGRIKFIDTYDNTYGEDYYEDGLREGASTTYYQSGELKEKITYEKGKIIARVDYFVDGSKRFELDTSDARNFGDNTEVGIGKLYWPNGKLKYEWHFTRRDPIGYRKSYNQEGELLQGIFFDEFNNQTEKQGALEEAPPPM